MTAIQSENSNLQNKNGDFLNIPMTEMANGESGILVTDDGEDAVHVYLPLSSVVAFLMRTLLRSTVMCPPEFRVAPSFKNVYVPDGFI